MKVNITFQQQSTSREAIDASFINGLHFFADLVLVHAYAMSFFFSMYSYGIFRIFGGYLGCKEVFRNKLFQITQIII